MTEIRILIADDNATLRGILESIVRSADSIGSFEIDTAVSGVEALRLYREKHHELMIIDNVMPDKDGITVLRELKADPRINQTHVMMVTGTITKELALTIRSEFLKIDDLIVKPVDFKKMKEKVAAVVSKCRSERRKDGPVLRAGEQGPKPGPSEPSLTAEIVDRGNIAVVNVRGRMLNQNRAVITGLFKKLPGIFAATVVIDVNEVDEIDEFGFGTLAVMSGWLALNDKEAFIAWDGCPLRDRLISLGINRLVSEHSSAGADDVAALCRGGGDNADYLCGIAKQL